MGQQNSYGGLISSGSTLSMLQQMPIGKVFKQEQTQMCYFLKQYAYSSEEAFQQAFIKFSKKLAEKNDNVLNLEKTNTKVDNSFCSTFYKIILVFQYIGHSLADEIQMRNKQSRIFEEKQIWSILFHCTLAIAHLRRTDRIEHSAIGIKDIRLSEDGIIKILPIQLVGLDIDHDQQHGTTKKLAMTILSCMLMKSVTNQSDEYLQALVDKMKCSKQLKKILYLMIMEDTTFKELEQYLFKLANDDNDTVARSGVSTPVNCSQKKMIRERESDSSSNRKRTQSNSAFVAEQTYNNPNVNSCSSYSQNQGRTSQYFKPKLNNTQAQLEIETTNWQYMERDQQDMPSSVVGSIIPGGGKSGNLHQPNYLCYQTDEVQNPDENDQQLINGGNNDDENNQASQASQALSSYEQQREHTSFKSHDTTATALQEKSSFNNHHEISNNYNSNSSASGYNKIAINDKENGQRPYYNNNHNHNNFKKTTTNINNDYSNNVQVHTISRNIKMQSSGINDNIYTDPNWLNSIKKDLEDLQQQKQKSRSSSIVMGIDNCSNNNINNIIINNNNNNNSNNSSASFCPLNDNSHSVKESSDCHNNNSYNNFSFQPTALNKKINDQMATIANAPGTNYTAITQETTSKITTTSRTSKIATAKEIIQIQNRNSSSKKNYQKASTTTAHIQGFSSSNQVNNDHQSHKHHQQEITTTAAEVMKNPQSVMISQIKVNKASENGEATIVAAAAGPSTKRAKQQECYGNILDDEASFKKAKTNKKCDVGSVKQNNQVKRNLNLSKVSASSKTQLSKVSVSSRTQKSQKHEKQNNTKVNNNQQQSKQKQKIQNSIEKKKQFKSNTSSVSKNKQDPDSDADADDISHLNYVQETYQKGEYKGYKLDGLRHGPGTFYYREGGKYKGRWKSNKMNGQGTLYYPNDEIAYQGNWKDDQLNGFGTLYNEEVTELHGPFNYGDWTEVQEYWTKYQGDFKMDNKEGKGKLHISNGQVFEGNFKEDMIEGQGVLKREDGSRVKGLWRRNKLVRLY